MRARAAVVGISGAAIALAGAFAIWVVGRIEIVLELRRATRRPVLTAEWTPVNRRQLDETKRGVMTAYGVYSLNHDLHDPARFTCMYGCAEPVTCPYPHAMCNHCRVARGEEPVGV